MSETRTRNKRKYALDTTGGWTAPADNEGATLDIVGGPLPYIWVGNGRGFCFGTLDTEGIRRLRDALTAVLR